jgi:ribonuclease HI
MTTIYIDGACSNNGNSNAKAGYGIYFGKNDKRNEYERIVGKQTNNTGEITAFIRCMEILSSEEMSSEDKIKIYTDSEYVIKCITTYGKKLEENNWKTDKNKNPPNIELVKKAYILYSSSKKVKIYYIEAHTTKMDEHSIGNREADKLANMAIGRSLDEESEEDILNLKEKMDMNEEEEIIYLTIEFANKDIAKKNGAMWDIKEKKWFYNNKKITIENKIFLEELSKKDKITIKENLEKRGEKIYIKIDFSKKDIAKLLGAYWDGEKKSWYYTEKLDIEKQKKLKQLVKN